MSLQEKGKGNNVTSSCYISFPRPLLQLHLGKVVTCGPLQVVQPANHCVRLAALTTASATS